MDEGKKQAMSAVFIIVGAVAGVALVVLGLITLALTGQIAFYILAEFDNSVWTDDTKFINQSNHSQGNTTFWNAAQAQQANDIENIQTALSAAGIAIGLIGILILVLVFFAPRIGVLAMLRNMSDKSN